MSIIVRDARKEDMKSVLDLINQLAVYEKEPDAVEVTVADLELHGYGENPVFHCFVAESNQEVLGIALVYMRFSTWKGPVLHLEDLVVNQSQRGLGIGTMLLDEVVKYGSKLNVKRICWEVLDWNEPAIQFYEQKGADVKRDWDVVHLDEAGIKNYISNI
ncbi:GNAT family N-acetyltransferase [Bizionia myxarmorum]|uniref:GNAT family N-acetyltransferase n=1 Tax=Bizionia myxarmorum TaxID=291186 RepID=A0A5D0RAI8_9FLAO|nr:GNAT family N-acetyltransferase [Bizionia myxarmorum]TYB78532.1 GNAT family N-acetyltransferase [Bizionia myxarmorum]